MKGLPRKELEDSIQEIFRGADGDGSGALDRAEFIRCLKESGLGFTRRELNLILSESRLWRQGRGGVQRRRAINTNLAVGLDCGSLARCLQYLACS